MSSTFSRRQFLGTTAAFVGQSAIATGPAAKTAEPDQFVDYDATGLAELVRKGEVTQSELVEVVIRRIEAINPILNFMTTPAYERARGMAGTIPNDSAFAGVPILMKDMIDVGGVRRTDGSVMLATNIPAKNVDYVDGVEEAGFNIIGMTNVPEFAGGLSTDNNLFGETRNPWNLDFTPLISSGGAAAAGAAGIVPLVHGTDGAGSNRMPASTCGLFGFKPSNLRMRSGEADGGHDRTKTNQAMSRTVRDSARLMDHTEDKSGAVYPPVGFVEGPSGKRLRIGFILDTPGGIAVSDEVREAQQSVAALLAGMGHDVVEAVWPVNTDEFIASYPKFFATRLTPLKATIEAMTGVPVTEAGLLTGFQASFAAHAATVPPEESERASAYLDTMPQAFATLFENVDMVLCPVMPHAGVPLSAFDHNQAYSESIMRFMAGNLKFTGPVNFAGNPAMSVPLTWGSADGLPIGSHFIAPIGGDATLYELAYELEEALPWNKRWAPVSIKYIPV